MVTNVDNFFDGQYECKTVLSVLLGTGSRNLRLIQAVLN